MPQSPFVRRPVSREGGRGMFFFVNLRELIAEAGVPNCSLQLLRTTSYSVNPATLPFMHLLW